MIEWPGATGLVVKYKTDRFYTIIRHSTYLSNAHILFFMVPLVA